MKRVSDLESKETLGQSKESREDQPVEASKVVGLFKTHASADVAAESGPPPLFSSPPPGSEPAINTSSPNCKAVGNFLLWRARGLPPLTTGEEAPDDTVYVGPLNKLPNRSDAEDAIRDLDPDFLAEEIKAKRKERAKEGIAGLAANLPATAENEQAED